MASALESREHKERRKMWTKLRRPLELATHRAALGAQLQLHLDLRSRAKRAAAEERWRSGSGEIGRRGRGKA